MTLDEMRTAYDAFTSHPGREFATDEKRKSVAWVAVGKAQLDRLLDAFGEALRVLDIVETAAVAIGGLVREGQR